MIMSLKFKIAFYNLMAFLAVFDVIYLLTWMLYISDSLFRGLIACGIAVILTPWASPSGYSTGRKVVIRSLVWKWYKKYQLRKSNQEIE